jgi:hypothetical protein
VAGGANPDNQEQCVPGDEETISVCPIVVKRLAGLPVETLATNNATHAALTALAAAETHLARAVRPAVEALEGALPHLHTRSRNAANAALTVKRALHNGKQPRDKDINNVLDGLGRDAVGFVRRAIYAIGEAATARNEYQAAYRHELQEISAKAVETLARPELLAAMRNSNPELAARIDKARRNPGGMKTKDLANANIGAVRQVARISLKTSPFGVYGEVEIGGWPSDGAADAPPERTIRNQPNYGPIGHVIESLASDFDKLGDEAPLRLNRSLTLDQGLLRWRKVENSPPLSRVRHIKMTESTSTSGALKVVVAAMAKIDQMTKSTLVSALSQMLPSQDCKKIENLARSAIASQLIVCGAIYGQRPLDAARWMAEALDASLKEEFASSLDKVIEAAEIGDAGGIAIQMAELARVADTEIKPQDVRPAIFQDTYSKGRAFTLETEPGFVEELATAVGFAQALDQPGHIEKARAQIAAFFVDMHGEGAKAPAMPFLESCLGLLQDWATNFSAPITKAEDVQHQAKIARISARLNEGGNECVRLTTEWAQMFINKRTRPRAVSQMCFMQEYNEDGETRYALNRCHAGWASSFSRFLDADSWAIAPIRGYLDMISEEGGAAEILGWFGFNAADRPDILPRKVFIPPIDTPESSAESIGAYGLRHRPEFGDLVFTGADGRDTTLTFTSILATGAMPQLHLVARMLGANSESVVETWAPFTALVRENADGVKRCPRVDVGRITVCRRQLIVPYNRTPGCDMDGVGYHRAFNDWMDDEDMPRWIYVTAPDERAGGGGAKRRQKPMPVDRRSPAMVLAMRKEIAGTSGEVRFVEALPQPFDVPSDDKGKRTMTELGVEFTTVRATP